MWLIIIGTAVTMMLGWLPVEIDALSGRV